MRKNLLRATLLSVVASSVLMADDSNIVKLDDVTVSANKIEENIKDVPQSITVISEEILQEKGIKNINDVIKEVPNMITSGSNNGVQTSFRGLNISTFTNNNPVVIYVDGVPYYDRYDFDPSLANVEQVEILRGPQGTLYGKDAIGAVINIITKTPSNEWHGNVGAEYGSNNYMQSTFNASGALIENKLYAGVNGSFQGDDGWITNNYPGMPKDADKDKERKTSAFLLFKPTDRLSGKLTVTDNYSKTNWMDGLNTADTTTPISSIKRDSAKNASFDVPTYEESKVKSQSLNLSYDFDAMNLESTTTHKKFDIDGDYDGDYISGTVDDGLRMFNYTNMDTWTQEVKLSGKTQDIKWVAGLYADDEERDIGPYGMEMNMGAVYIADVYAKANSKTQALFGQTMIPLADKFELTIGGRYQKIKKDIDLTMSQTFGGVAMPGSPFDYKDEKTWNTFLPKVALSYKNNDSLTTYASISKGYMPGGFNYFAMSGGTAENSFDPQKSTNYEVGMKYIGENYLLNTSVFRMDIEDIHIYKTVGGTLFLTDNAKKAHSQGIEIDGKYFLTDNIELSGALGLIDAKYDDYDTGTAIYDGKRIENTPRYTANVGIAYVSESGIYGRLDAYARGKTSFFDGANNTMVTADGAIISNLKVGYKIKDWDIYGYIKNITDEEYIDSFRSSGNRQIVGFNEPRTFGIGARYKF
ncbi:MAG: TonB-dependent receptor [Arcobacteraceae bacterium]|nr:TonB-dependent receptor [Arcobacteraceae bacterium]